MTSDSPWHLAAGYRYAGVGCGLRPAQLDRLDLALIVSDRPAPRGWRVYPKSRGRRAGACLPGTSAGYRGARRRYLFGERQRLYGAARFRGRPPHDRPGGGTNRLSVGANAGLFHRRHRPAVADGENRAGIRAAAANLDAAPIGLDRAAHAILTTDTRIKVATRVVPLDGRDYRLTGFAKGAAMIGPNMATMLAFVLTDAPVAADDLARWLLWPRRKHSTASASKATPAPTIHCCSWRTGRGWRCTAQRWALPGSGDRRLWRIGPGHGRRRRGRHPSGDHRS